MEYIYVSETLFFSCECEANKWMRLSMNVAMKSDGKALRTKASFVYDRFELKVKWCSCIHRLNGKTGLNAKNGHTTTTNIILILYLQFTSKATRARYTLCPGNFRIRIHVACAEKRLLADMMKNIRRAQSIDTHPDGSKYSMWVFWKLLLLPAINSLYHAFMQIGFV